MTSQMNEDLFEMANVSPMHAAKECRQKIAHLERGYHAKLRHCVAEAYAVAYGMARDNDAWRTFTKDGFWKKRKKRPRANRQNKILLHVDGLCVRRNKQECVRPRVEIRHGSREIF